ncbi:DUF4919 domain-containing protein [Microbulbifer magnicolonia]|uniref:DUF4919 domain-containing protein n=1 Tax=Microbulbifer magnicolonia TaxID=3109744 RepID=UPI002B40ACBF|nr:DUF4919 domain-containing protein [Microbulbifer sp. GG15]
MKYLVLASFVFLAACATTPPAKTDAALSPKAIAPTAAATRSARLKSGNSNSGWYQQALAELQQNGNRAGIADFQRVREAYTTSARYAPYTDPLYEVVKSGIQQMQKGDWTACAGSAAEIVQANYTSLSGHFLGMTCNAKAGNREAGESHRFALDGFMAAIRSTGNGKTMETAYHTYSPQELRAFLQLQGLEIVDQSLVRGERGIYDQMGVRDPKTGRTFRLYFNITKQWAEGTSKFN